MLLNQSAWTKVHGPKCMRRAPVHICFHSCPSGVQVASMCATKAVTFLVHVRHGQSAALTHVLLNNGDKVRGCLYSPFACHIDRIAGISAHVRRVQFQQHLLFRMLGCAVRQENRPQFPVIQPASQVAVHSPCHELSHTPQEPCNKHSMGKQGVAKHKLFT